MQKKQEKKKNNSEMKQGQRGRSLWQKEEKKRAGNIWRVETETQKKERIEKGKVGVW